MHDITPFSGSYLPDDIQFLLKPIQIEMTPVEVKEKLIQSGARHYSDMLSQEPAPTEHHLTLFARALDQGATRMAREVVMLAKALINRFGDTPIVLASLVRAGVPLGVMLHHTLRALGKTSFHYGISIIRDRGIDEVALSYIEQKHGTEGLVFVDGWTGKGAITGELTRSLQGRPGYPELPRLVVLADPCGCSWLSATDDDWLIPFGIMGAPVSGLVSRSLWSEKGLHGCVHCEHLQEFECSQLLVNTVADCRQQLDLSQIPAAEWDYRVGGATSDPYAYRRGSSLVATRRGVGGGLPATDGRYTGSHTGCSGGNARRSVNQPVGWALFSVADFTSAGATQWLIWQ